MIELPRDWACTYEHSEGRTRVVEGVMRGIWIMGYCLGLVRGDPCVIQRAMEEQE
jgi:hypothetical protein